MEWLLAYIRSGLPRLVTDEDGSISSETVEALGWLLAEMGHLSATLFVLVARYRALRV